MSLYELTKLAPCVAAGAEYADRKIMHKECITLQIGPVNLGQATLARCITTAVRPPAS